MKLKQLSDFDIEAAIDKYGIELTHLPSDFSPGVPYMARCGQIIEYGILSPKEAVWKVVKRLEAKDE